MQTTVNKSNMLFCDYYKQWISVYKEGAIRPVTMNKYNMAHNWLIKLIPDLIISDLDRITYQKLLNDYAAEHERQTTMDFHHHLGYRLVGEFYQCGYKFDTWYHMVWMEKIIGEHQKKQPAMIPFPELLKKDPTPWEV